MTVNGSTACGLISRLTVAWATIAAPQNGHVPAVWPGWSVCSAPHPSHRTVTASIVSASAARLLQVGEEVQLPLTGRGRGLGGRSSTAFSVPQYGHLSDVDPGSQNSFAPQLRAGNWRCRLGGRRWSVSWRGSGRRDTARGLIGDTGSSSCLLVPEYGMSDGRSLLLPRSSHGLEARVTRRLALRDAHTGGSGGGTLANSGLQLRHLLGRRPRGHARPPDQRRPA